MNLGAEEEELCKSKRLLSESFLRVCDRSGLLICTKPNSCSTGFLVNRDVMRHHLRTHHSVASSKNKNLFESAKALSDEASDPGLAVMYSEGGARHGVLPLLEGLPVLKGKQCTFCDRIFVTEKTLQTHVGRDHPGRTITRAVISKLSVVKCQSLRGNVRPFLVATKGLTANTEQEDLYDPGAVVLCTGHDVEQVYKSPFVSVANVPQRLSDCGLSLEIVHLILGQSSPWSATCQQKWMSDVKEVIRDDFDEAKQRVTRCSQFFNFRSVIQTSGVEGKDRPFKFLDNDAAQEERRREGFIARDTKQRYVDYMALIVRIACMVAAHGSELKDVSIDASLKKEALCVLHGGLEKDAKSFATAIFQVIWIVLSEEKMNAEKGSEKTLFAYVVCACLCVHHDGEDNPKMSTGLIVSSKLAGILYGASCYFALYVLRYHAGADFDVAMERVKNLTSPQSQCGVCYLTDLRTICSYLREEERKINPFQVCEEHDMCGVFAGKEFSARQYGDAVKRMHNAIEQLMFVDLMNDKKLPTHFWESAEALTEDVDKDLLGYWALSDVRNRDFVQTMATWAKRSCNIKALLTLGWQQWRGSAESLLMLLLAALHISGGGPARGTELGSLTLRNTIYGGRSVFFLKNEVMLLPYYSKTRNLKKGHVNLLTRHVDIETSRLLRAFFLLVHPVLVFFDETCTPGTQQRHAVANVRDSLSLGRWRPEKLSEEIGKVFLRFGIPFSFSQFRQHQRGLAKSKKDKSLAQLLAGAAEAAAKSSTERDKQEECSQFKASMEQAGHTAHTADVYYAHMTGVGGHSVKSTADKIQIFRQASQEWHTDLGLRSRSQLQTITGQAETGGCFESFKISKEGTKEESSVQKIAEKLSKHPALVQYLQKRTPAEIFKCLKDTSSNTCGIEPTASTETFPRTTERVSKTSVIDEGAPDSRDDAPHTDTAIFTEETHGYEVGVFKGTGFAPDERVGIHNLSQHSIPAATPETVRSGNLVHDKSTQIKVPKMRSLYSLKDTSIIAGAQKEDNAKPSSNNLPIGTVSSDTADVLGSVASVAKSDCRGSEGQPSPQTSFAGTIAEVNRRCIIKPSPVQRTCAHGETNGKSGMKLNGSFTLPPKMSNHFVKDPRPPCQVEPSAELHNVASNINAGHGRGIGQNVTGRIGKNAKMGFWKRFSRRQLKNVVSDKANKEKLGGAEPSLSSDEVEEQHLFTNGQRNCANGSQHSGIRTSRACVKRSNVSDQIFVKERTEKNTKPPGKDAMLSREESLNLRLSEVTKDGELDLSEAIFGPAQREVDCRKPRSGADKTSSVLQESSVCNASFDALKALRTVTAPRAQFKSKAQRVAMEAVASRRGHLLIILGTGEGKTAVVMGPITTESGVTVWVCPLRALRWETQRRLKSGGLEVFSLEDFNATRTKKGVGMVLLVSPEDVHKSKFRHAVDQMRTRNVLNRLVVDEAHLTVMARSYRYSFMFLKSAALYGTLCPIVMLTATAPPLMERHIALMCGSDVLGLEVHRGDPCRANLFLRVEYLNVGTSQHLNEKVVKVVKSKKGKYRSAAAKILIVCLTIADANEVYKCICSEDGLKEDDLLLYHSNRDDRVREKVMKRWNSGLDHGIRVVVATEGFSTGTDSPNVRLVVFAGACRNIVDFWQGAGRAGRDGGEGEVVVLFHEAHLKRGLIGKGESQLSEIEKQAGDFGAWARNKKDCRRSGVERSLTGYQDALTCTDRLKNGVNVVLCDICANVGVRLFGKVSKSVVTLKKRDNLHLFGSGVRRPNERELSESKEHQRKRAKLFCAEKAWLRQVAENVDNMCPEHLLQLFNCKRNIALTASAVRREIGKSTRCDGSCEKYIRRCHRCQGKDHKADDCPVFDSIVVDKKTGISTGDGRCRECRLLSVNGQNPHEDLEFGKPNCHLRSCLYLMMRAWEKKSIRETMLEADVGLSWHPSEPPQNREQFAKWLTIETATKQARICDGLRWLIRHLPGDLGRARF